MEKFKTVISKIIPLPLSDVDTDQIIPARFMTSISREGYGENLFRELRDKDANFPLNLAQYKGREILVVNENFGCGSSREHAVWAITGVGIKVIIAKSFADIFFSNSAKNGLLLVTLPPAVVDRIMQECDSVEDKIKIDLASQSVELANGEIFNFEFDAFRKHCMLQGLDDIDYIQSHTQDILQYRQQQQSRKYFSTLEVNR